MSKKLMVLFVTAIIALMQLLISCGNKPVEVQSTTQKPLENSQPTTEEQYSFPDINFDGNEFNILNASTEWNFYTALDHESMTGEILDDAIYTRNRLIEEKFNLKIKETEEPITSIHTKIRNTIQSGEDVYDAIFCPGWIENSNIGTLAVEGLFYDLSEISEINLNEKWWNQAVSKEASIGSNKSLYFAANDINILCLQGAWCLYFNEDMFENLSLERPYDLVKSGTWTLDKFITLVKAGTTLNGDESFEWNPSGNCIYGYTSFDAGTLAMLLGTGERFISKDDSGTPQLALDTQRFYDVSTKIASLLGMPGEYASANEAGQTGYHYEDLFMKSRALFVAAELKAATRFRVMEDAYGILPMPKYDESQDRYYATQFRQSYMLVIPVTNQEPQKTGAVLDALAYVSYRDVTPVFYNITISQKGLRNEESIEMLELIRDSLFFDVGITYGWTGNLNSAIIGALDKGNGSVSSIIESNKDKVLIAIQKTMDELNS